MDVPVPPAVRQRRKRQRWFIACSSLGVVAIVTIGLARMEPAVPHVQRSSLYIGTVRQGEMLRQVRGSGTLVPEQIQLVQAETAGRVERILVQPGTAVISETVLMELSNPELDQERFDAEWQLKGAEAQLEKLKAKLQDEILTLKSSVAALGAEAAQAEADSNVNDALARDRLISEVERKRARTKADALNVRVQLERERFTACTNSVDAQLAVQQADVERTRALLARKKQQLANLKVRSGVNGVLQQIGDTEALQSGQRVQPGATLAKVVEPTRLKAVLKIPETQVKDVQLGQPVDVDTRNGIVSGEVIRIDPAAHNGTVTLEVKLLGTIPKGARPDLSVDGVVQLERLQSVVYMDLPVHGQEHSTLSVFRLTKDGKTAQQVPVKLGRSSMTAIEILEGLQMGDRVILSDMAEWNDHLRLRVD